MSRPIAREGTRRRRERGAVAFLTPVVLLFIALPVLALAIDVGRMAWNKRQLQEVADLAALDAMRAFGQCTETSGDPVAAAQASAVRNGYDGNLAQAPNQVQIGSVTTQADMRVFTAGGTPATATAVRVFATRDVPFTLIASALFPGDARLSVEAVAARQAAAGLQVGSFAARIDPGDGEVAGPIACALLGCNISLSAVSYEGLANANLELGDLVAAANVGTLEDLLSLELTGPEYLSLLAEALSDGGNSSAASTLQSLAGAVDAGLTVTVGDIFDVAAETSDAALTAQLNAFDMLMAGAEVARGDSAIMIDPLAVSIPGVLPDGVSMKLRVIQAPQIDIGPPGKDADGEWITSVRTGQVRMAMTLKLGNLPVLGGQKVSLDLFVESAQTEAHLTAIDCADASDPVHRVVVDAEPGLVRLGIGKYPDFQNSPDPVATDLVSVNLPLVGGTVTGFADMPFQSDGEELRFDGPFVPQIDVPSDDNTQTIGMPVGNSISNALSTMLGETQLTVVPKPPLPPLTITQKNAALAAVVNMLGPVLNALDGPLGSIFDALGLSLGGADIKIWRLDTDQPQLAR